MNLNLNLNLTQCVITTVTHSRACHQTTQPSIALLCCCVRAKHNRCTARSSLWWQASGTHLAIVILPRDVQIAHHADQTPRWEIVDQLRHTPVQLLAPRSTPIGRRRQVAVQHDTDVALVDLYALMAWELPRPCPCSHPAGTAVRWAAAATLGCALTAADSGRHIPAQHTHHLVDEYYSSVCLEPILVNPCI